MAEYNKEEDNIWIIPEEEGLDEKIENILQNNDIQDEVEDFLDKEDSHFYITNDKRPGSGVKNRTEEKQAQCPICKNYFRKLSRNHLTTYHNISWQNFEKIMPDHVRYFTDPEYAIANSDYVQEEQEKERIRQAFESQKPYQIFFKKEEKDISEESNLQKKENTRESAEDLIEKGITKLLDGICIESHLNRNSIDFLDTPKRVVRAYKEMLKGAFNKKVQLDTIFRASFPSEYDGVLVQGPIRAYGLCPHHLLKVEYDVYVGYKSILKGTNVGLSKLSRAVDLICSQPIKQEDVAVEIAEVLNKYLECEGIAIYIEGIHDCMKIRGASQKDAKTITNYFTGCFLENKDIKKEFIDTVKIQKEA